MRFYFRYVLLTILLITGFHSYAQTHYEANIAIGAKSGMTLSKVNFQPSVPQSLLRGYMGGIMFRYVEEKNFGVIVELNLEQRGWKETFKNTSFAFQRRLTYIHLPILTHIFFGSPKIQGFFNAGPEIAYMLSNSTSSNFDYNNLPSVKNFPSENRNTDQFTLPVKYKFDYGISAGAGAEFISKKNSFLLEGRFYYGLHDIFPNHAKDTFSGSSGMAIMISLGYFYRIK
jgi:hypothetical protein